MPKRDDNGSRNSRNRRGRSVSLAEGPVYKALNARVSAGGLPLSVISAVLLYDSTEGDARSAGWYSQVEEFYDKPTGVQPKLREDIRDVLREILRVRS